jgi:sugar lactone lactonase YvrE
MSEIRCVVAANDILGETPLWCTASQSLWWLDIDGTAVQRFTPATERHDTFKFSAQYVGSLALRADGSLLVALDRALHLFDPQSGALTRFAQVEPDTLDNRLNDGRCDARGRLWVGTMDNQLTRPNGAFYRVDPDGSVTRQFGDVIVSNTVAIAPDQRTLYFSDTRRFVTWAFDLDVADGALTNRRVFVDHSATRERPDGACVDAEGCVWNAIFAGGKVIRFTPRGDVDRVVAIPTTNPTCLCFGGPDLKTLFVTTARKFLTPERLQAEPLAGAVLAFETDVPGLPEARFGA